MIYIKLINEIENCINTYFEKAGKYPGEIRLSVENFKKLAKELYPELPNEELLYKNIVHKGVKITFGIQFNYKE